MTPTPHRRTNRTPGGTLISNTWKGTFILVSLLFVIVIMLTLSFLIRDNNTPLFSILSDSSSKRANNDNGTPSIEHIQKLLHDTKVLLKDVNAANLTLNHNTINDIHSISHERSQAIQEIQKAIKMYEESQRDYHACTDHRLKEAIGRENCESKIEKMTKYTVEMESKLSVCEQALQRSSSSSSSSSAAVAAAGGGGHNSNPNDVKEEKEGKYTSISTGHGHEEETVELPVPQISTPARTIDTHHNHDDKDDQDGKDHHENADGSKWLVIGIPTVPRKANQDYLLRTLAAIAKECPSSKKDLLYNKILTVVVNMQAKGHLRFDEARELYSSQHTGPESQKAQYFEFISLGVSEIHSPDMQDIKKGATAQNDLGNANHPGYRVRRQTRSIAMVMQKSMHRGHYFLFLEDDMLVCPGAFMTMQYMLAKATRYYHNWMAIRASYGMNGIFLHDDDMTTFRHYLLTHQGTIYPDMAHSLIIMRRMRMMSILTHSLLPALSMYIYSSPSISNLLLLPSTMLSLIQDVAPLTI
jgi:hypothetical protein